MVKKQLSDILLNYQTPTTSVSVNNIKISPDLKIAHVYIGIFGADTKAVYGSIAHNRGEISKELATRIESKFSPGLSFHLDNGQDDTMRIGELLKS